MRGKNLGTHDTETSTEINNIRFVQLIGDLRLAPLPPETQARINGGTPRLNVAIDTQAILTHELGHSLGIGHTTDTDATMGAASCKVDGRTLNSDDRAALQCSTNRYPYSPAYDGHFDGSPTFNCSQVSGWAWNSDWANDPIYVHILDGSTMKAAVLADQYRADLLAAGKGNGYHGFTYTIPATMKNGQWHTLHAQTSGTGSELTSSPRNLICAVSIFTSQAPSEFNDHTGQAYSVGNVFTSSENGVITHLRYYRQQRCQVSIEALIPLRHHLLTLSTKPTSRPPLPSGQVSKSQDIVLDSCAKHKVQAGLRFRGYLPGRLSWVPDMTLSSANRPSEAKLFCW